MRARQNTLVFSYFLILTKLTRIFMTQTRLPLGLSKNLGKLIISYLDLQKNKDDEHYNGMRCKFYSAR